MPISGSRGKLIKVSTVLAYLSTRVILTRTIARALQYSGPAVTQSIGGGEERACAALASHNSLQVAVFND